VRSALRHIRERRGDVDPEALARAAGISVTAFRRLFRRATGRKPAEHARLIRLARAAAELRDGSRAITAIARDAGFASGEGFARAMRRAFGAAPSVLRGRQRAGRRRGGEPLASATLALVKLPVRDFARARGFYRDRLGLREEFAVEAYGWAQYRLGDQRLCLYAVGLGGGDGVPGGDRGLHIGVGDITGCRSLLVHRGVACGAMEATDDGGLTFVVTDSEGNRLTICGARPVRSRR